MKPLRWLAVTVFVLGAALWLGVVWYLRVPVARHFDAPARTEWRPVGPRRALVQRFGVLPEPVTFTTMHANTGNTDEVWSAAAPMFELDWVVEQGFYIPEGPTLDNHGQLYFSPVNPREDVTLVALDARTGERRWAIAGSDGGGGGGAPLILDDPEHPGEQLVHHATYERALALRADGSVVWETRTGLRRPPVVQGEFDFTHHWGLNYLPQADALVGLTMDGWVFALDRRSGRPLLAQPFRLPGAASAPAAMRLGSDTRIGRAIARRLITLANAETDAAFGKTPGGRSLFEQVFNVVFGGGVQVANYFAIDPRSGRIYVAATAPDESDGVRDGVSANGAVYLLELRRTDDASRALSVSGSYVTRGGTGSTPTISADGERLLISDDLGHVMALDANLHEIWRVDVGAQVAASIAVADDDRELYAVTKDDVIKLRDGETSGEIVWRAKLDAYPGFENFNALTPTVTANGVVVSIGAGRKLGNATTLAKVGVGLLDRETGSLRWFAEGREDSIAVTVVGPDGAIYTGASPIRRAFTRPIYGDRLPPITGGITRYRPIRRDLLVRDASCAAGARAGRALSIRSEHPESAQVDARQIAVLLRQASDALAEAEQAGELAVVAVEPARAGLRAALAATNEGRLEHAAALLHEICLSID